MPTPTLGQQVLNLATQIAATDRDLYGKLGSLASLSTTAKNNLVAAINELATRTQINDTATSSTSTTLSAQKIGQLISAGIAQVVGMSPSDLDTLAEIAARLQSNETGDQAVVTALGKRIRVDAVQAFTDLEKAQGRDNLGGIYLKTEIGDLSTFDPVATYLAVLNA